MAILEVLTFPDPILRQKCTAVTSFDAELRKTVSDMLDTMYDAPGVGLAANQVGITKRIVVIDVDYEVRGDDETTRTLVNQNARIFINPEIVKKKGEMVFKEGCLSVPGFSEDVKRFKTVTIRYQDVDGKHHEIEAGELLGVAIQHEIDHLDGKLYIDRLSQVKQGLIKGKLIKKRGEKFERSKFHVEL